jgi:hypothetical protein
VCWASPAWIRYETLLLLIQMILRQSMTLRSFLPSTQLMIVNGASALPCIELTTWGDDACSP